MGGNYDAKEDLMFRSKTRPVIIPQYEHGRLAGTFASLWGNRDFQRPAIDFEAFVQGVAFHDWHYGVVDNFGIGELTEAEWLEIVRKGVAYRFDDPIVDIVAKLHMRRLLGGRDAAVIAELIDRIDIRIAERLPQTNYQREQFEWADRITNCCDMLAFDFSFEQPVKGSLAVFADEKAVEDTTITYEIRPDGEIAVAPWPFCVDAIRGVMIGYHAEDYPGTLKPEIISFLATQ